MNNPLISILIPCYNVENYVIQCIDSIIRQKFDNIEILVYDDGSTDNTLDILLREYSFNNNIKIYNSKNEGLLLTRRKLLKKSRGDYILFVDSDDMLRDDALNIISDYIMKFKSDIIIYNASQDINYNIPFRKKIYKYDYNYVGEELKILKKDVISTTNLNNLCFKAVKRNIIDINNDYSIFGSITSGEDILQTLPIFNKAKSVVFINENLYYYRVNPKSITHMYNRNRYYSTVTVLNEIYNYAMLWSNDEDMIDCYHVRCLNSIYGCIKNIIKANNKIDYKVKEMEVISNDYFFLEEMKYIELLDSSAQKYTLKSVEKKRIIVFYLVNLLYKINSKLKSFK